MQVIPVDEGRLEGLVCVTAPVVRADPETGQVKPNRRGEPVYLVGVAGRRKDTRRAWVIDVQTLTEPVGIREGSAVRLVDLEASPWEVEARHGLTWRASAVLPVDETPVASVRGKAAVRGGDSS